MMNRISSRFRTPLIVAASVMAILGISVLVTKKFSTHADLAVPYVPQVFHDNWVAPWDEACEEASITMIDAYYAKRASVSENDARQQMEGMFEWERNAFQKIEDTNADQTAKLIEEKGNFRSVVKRNPSVEDIKSELKDNHPVIALVNMYHLYQEPNLGDSYHVLVIRGFDDSKKEFIVHDPARQNQTRYAYDVLLKALHDFDAQTREASGTPTVLFTQSKNWLF
jgi:hypothetical protein